MPTFKLVIPLLNDHISLFRGPFLYITEAIYFEKITDAEHSALWRFGNEDLKNSVRINETKCIKAVFQSEPSEEDAQKLCTRLHFLLNVLSDQNPLIIQWSILVEGDQKLVVKKVIEHDAIANYQELRKHGYKINVATQRDALIQFFGTIGLAIAQDANAYFTIRKFNTSLTRSDFYDTIIDSTICLESFVSGNAELNFRLALYTAYITSNNGADRLESFNRIKQLYDIRSKIVHGDINQASINTITGISQNWSYYHGKIKSALTYYLIYVSNHTRDQWNDHLKGIILNVENAQLI
jgi:hypothetical protein